MSNAAVRTMTVNDSMAMVRNQVEEHIQEKVDKIQMKKAVAEGRLRKAIRFLFSCDSANPCSLNPEMQARLYL